MKCSDTLNHAGDTGGWSHRSYLKWAATYPGSEWQCTSHQNVSSHLCETLYPSPKSGPCVCTTAQVIQLQNKEQHHKINVTSKSYFLVCPNVLKFFQADPVLAAGAWVSPTLHFKNKL